MHSFSEIDFNSAIQIDPYLLYRKKLIVAFKLNKELLGSGTRF